MVLNSHNLYNIDFFMNVSDEITEDLQEVQLDKCQLSNIDLLQRF